MNRLLPAVLRLMFSIAIFAFIMVMGDTFGPSWAGHLAHLGVGVVTPPTAAWCLLPQLTNWKASWLASALTGMVIGLLQLPRDIWWFYGSAISLAILLIIWFWTSARRKRATQALGSKARMIRARLARTMRERHVPLPQPV